MKYIANNFFFTSQMNRRTFLIAMCALFLLTSQNRASGQWKLASGFSNANASLPNEVDEVAGFTSWGDSLLASAYCADDLLNFINPAPDSLFLSIDHGQTWTDYAPYGERPFVVVGNDFIGGAQPSPQDNNISDAILSYSTDFGQTWISDTTGGGVAQASSIVTIGSIIFASNAFSVLQQLTPGSTWTIDTSGLTLGGNISSVGSLIASGNNLFLYTQDNGVFVSTNQGTSWSSANNGLPTYSSSTVNNGLFQVGGFAVSGSSVFALVAHDTDVFGGGDNFDSIDIYLTTNNGGNWGKMNTAILNWGFVDGFIASGENLFIAADSGFYYSSNNGSTWAQANQGLHLVPGDFPNSVQISGGNIIIGTNSSGAWYRSLSDFGVSSVTASPAPVAGLNLALSDNPASSSEVKVTYTLSDAGAVQVMLVDELGRTIRMLQNGPAIPGKNTLTIDPLTLEVGTYFVRLTHDGASAMQKLVIAR
jgi:hypothetical protein